MATTAQVKTFIATLSKIAVKEYIGRKSSGRKWVLPSVCIAQAALETGWGTSPIMVKANAYFGIKAGTSWTGKVYSSKTQECYDRASFTTITDLFRAYDSLEESVADYFELITSMGRYAFACNQTNPKICIQAIWDGGYATDPDYVTQVMSIINQYNLTQYDAKEGGDKAMSKTEKAIFQMEAWARDDSHGYDQIYRWGEKGDYDCSAAVIQAWENAGVPVKSNGATYTGDMYDVFIRLGFKDVTGQVNKSTGSGLKRGDVLLNESHHVAMYCGDGMEVEASINEKGTATGGKPGDQTGKEFLIRSYRNYPWDCVLRYQEDSASSGNSGSSGSSATTTTEAVAYVARMDKDTQTYIDAGKTKSSLYPLLKKDTLVDVIKGKTIKDTAGKSWYLVRVGHPSEGFVREYVLAGSFRHLK